MAWGRPVVNFRLDPAVTAQLDRYAAMAGVTRSDLIRKVLEEYLDRMGVQQGS